MSEIFEVGDLYRVARLPGIEIVDQLLLGIKEDEPRLELLLHGLDFSN